METKPIKKIVLQPIESRHLNRRQFISAVSTGAGLGVLSCLLCSLLPKESNETSESTPTSPPEPRSTLPPEAPLSTRESQPSPTLQQEPPVPTETRVRNRFVIGGINFANQENPLTLSYPANFEENLMVTFENIQILFAGGNGENTFYTQYRETALVYPDTPSGTFVFGLHDAWYQGAPLEAEPLRRLIEGNLSNPHPQEIIEANLQKIVGQPFFFSQNNQTARFVITQAKRLTATQEEEFHHQPENISLALEQIQKPEDSFILMTCSGRQSNEPNETFPGRYLLVLRLQS